MTRSRRDVINHIHSVLGLDVLDEVESSLERFGVQSLPDGTANYPFAKSLANSFRSDTNRAADDGVLTWRHVFLEEVFEAMAETEYSALRAELIQVINVAVKWVDDLDARQLVEVPRDVDLAMLKAGAEMPKGLIDQYIDQQFRSGRLTEHLAPVPG